MWDIGLAHWWEFVVRAVVVYAFLVVLLRVTGKRQVAHLAPFDFVLLLVLSNAVQNSMNGGDNSLTGGLILATTLVAMNFGVGWLTQRSRRVESLVEGRPVVVIHDGVVDGEAMARQRMTRHELDAALRTQGVSGPHQVRFAVLESGGALTVIRRHESEGGHAG